MRPISWLHISDFHFRERQTWPQDVVLSEMCKEIERRGKISTIDVILATGDLVFDMFCDAVELHGVDSPSISTPHRLRNSAAMVDKKLI